MELHPQVFKCSYNFDFVCFLMGVGDVSILVDEHLLGFLVAYSQLLSCAEGLQAAKLSGESGCGGGEQHYVVGVECCPYCNVGNGDSISRVQGGAHMFYYSIEKEPE